MVAFRSITGSILAAALLLSASPASAITYISTRSNTENAVSYVQREGFMNGYDNGSFGERNVVNRAEMAKVVTLIDNGNINRYSMRLPFYDTSNTAWYTPYVIYVYGNGFMSGYPDNSFRPDHSITFAEAAKVLALAYNLDARTTSGEWYQESVRALADRNAIPTSIDYVEQTLTRGELAEIVYRLDSNNRSRSSRSYEDLVGSSRYDSYNRYNRYRTTTCNGDDVQISIESDSRGVGPGDTLRYTIEVENCNDDDQLIDVTANIDSQTSYLSSSPESNSRYTDRLEWRNLRIRRGDTYTITLSVSVRSFAGVDDRIDLSVRAEDEDGDATGFSKAIYLSEDQNCWRDARGVYRCDDDDDCYYSNGRYHCDDYDNDDDCYYDANNRYRCDDDYYDDYNDDDDCYYSNGRYHCDDYDNDDNDDCYYDANNHYRCDDDYYDDYNDDDNDCYYDSNGRYRCDDDYYDDYNDDCYYDSRNNYICY
ncbi:S-layer homology domain-containing protein [Candidatus Peribacteria bacterium]|nr:MAG: S-layer homology domain-containing protein [Candidatus Peribacteria bacterium]